MTRALFLLACVGLSGCVQKMATEGRIIPYAPGSTLNAPLAGTVARGSLEKLQPEPKVTLAHLQRGRERFEIYCAPCHSPSGDGNGWIVQNGMLPPPSFHTDRLRKAPDAHFFDVMTKGYGAMFSYADRVAVQDRWAIVQYVRALQLSQNAKLSDLAPEEQERLRKESP